MKHLRDKFVRYLVYGGISKQEYKEIEDEILEKDRSSLCATAGCVVLMFTGLLIGSLFSEMMAPNRLVYGITGGCFLFIHVICRGIKNRKKRLVIPLWYVALTIIFGYATVLNTIIRNDISATTFCLVIVVAPLLIIDKPWRVFIYFVLVICCFIPIDFRHKPYYLAFTDSVNAICCVFMGGAIHYRIIRTKMQEMKQKRYIEKERDTDALTGCLTKSAFQRRFSEKENSTMSSGVLFVMDLDHFKSVNDTYGHVFGDMILRTMGECIRQNFPDTAFCGRFGGDEFQVWMPGKYDRKEICKLLDQFLFCIQSIETPDGRVRLSASIGVAVCPENADKYKALFENADAALYAAKNMGRNRYVFCPQNRMRTTCREGKK